jgi:hypothetical protein
VLDPKAAGSWILPNYANTDCWKEYEPGTILGKGTFGTTYLATKKGTTEKYAVKVSAGSVGWADVGSGAMLGRRHRMQSRREESV